MITKEDLFEILTDISKAKKPKKNYSKKSKQLGRKGKTEIEKKVISQNKPIEICKNVVFFSHENLKVPLFKIYYMLSGNKEVIELNIETNKTEEDLKTFSIVKASRIQKPTKGNNIRGDYRYYEYYLVPKPTLSNDSFKALRITNCIPIESEVYEDIESIICDMYDPHMSQGLKEVLLYIKTSEVPELEILYNSAQKTKKKLILFTPKDKANKIN